MFLQQELEKLDITPQSIELGYFETTVPITDQKLKMLDHALRREGLELLNTKKNNILEKTKKAIEELLNADKSSSEKLYSTYLMQKVGVDYQYLSKLFSETKGITIQQFIINRKIEKVKDLLIHEQLSLSEIAHRLHYSSVAHLSHQFKKITGLTISSYKKIN